MCVGMPPWGGVQIELFNNMLIGYILSQLDAFYNTYGTYLIGHCIGKIG